MIFTKISVWVEVFKLKQKLSVSPNDYIELDHVIESIKLLDEMCPVQFTMVYDYNKNEALYESVQTDLFHREEDWKINHENFLKNVHPKDIPYLYEIFNTLFKKYAKSLLAKYKDYVLIYNCRLKRKNKDYTIVEVKQRTIRTDKNGNPWVTIVTLNHIDKDEVMCAQLRNVHTNEVIELFENECKACKIDFTQREKEIITCVNNGMKTNEISESLDISIETVRFHGKNIRKKTGANTLKEAVLVAGYKDSI